MAIWGIENDEGNYQRFEFVLLPCNYVHAEISDIGDKVDPQCDSTQQE